MAVTAVWATMITTAPRRITTRFSYDRTDG